MHNKIIIADTSCLIIFTKIQQLDVLNVLFSDIVITPQIQLEFNNNLPNWIKINKANELLVRSINNQLDLGESSAIALALETEKHLLILDDLKARKFAKSANLNIIGTVGIIAKAAIENHIDAVDTFNKIQNTNFRISDKLLEKILNEIKTKKK